MTYKVTLIRRGFVVSVQYVNKANNSHDAVQRAAMFCSNKFDTSRTERIS